jgi:hypothetical protein
MTLDLDIIQARADAATEGPWAWEATGEKDNSWAVGLIQDDDGEPIEGENEPGDNIVIEGICEGIDAHIPDAEFIAHARQDVPALVAELRAARETCHALQRWVALPGMFWGDTPETGSEVGAALTNWQKVTEETSQ